MNATFRPKDSNAQGGLVEQKINSIKRLFIQTRICHYAMVRKKPTVQIVHLVFADTKANDETEMKC